MIYYVDVYGKDWIDSGDLPELDSVDESEILYSMMNFKDPLYEIVQLLIHEDPEILIDWTTAREYATERYLCFRLSEIRYAEFLLTFS